MEMQEHTPEKRAPMTPRTVRENWKELGRERRKRVLAGVDTIIDRVEALLEERSMSWTELSCLCGGPETSAYHWKKRRSLDIRSLAVAADVFHVNAGYLLGLEPRRDNP